MPIKYAVAELKALRASPLICIPDNLPPLEEWMGSAPEPRAKAFPTRSRPDDNSLQNELSQKRPTLGDTHHMLRRSSTAPEDIVLGPPKTAFASASSRNAPKTHADADQGDGTSGSRLAFRDKQARDGDGEKRDGRYNGNTTRRFGREDRDDWQNGRSRRQDPEEDSRTKRNGDRERPRWERETRDDENADTKRNPREGLRDGPRRDARGKFESPWLRGDSRGEAKVELAPDEDRSTNKTQNWRRERGSGRVSDWERSERAEQDPEWMDAASPKEPAQAHTAEDFQRWKEQKRAEAGGRDLMLEKAVSAPQPAVKKGELPPLPSFFQPQADSGMDKFFAAYSNKMSVGEPKPAEEAKSQRKPRFAALFTPQPDPAQMVSDVNQASRNSSAPPLAAPPPAERPKKAPSDQEGFQRILEMLAVRSSSEPAAAQLLQPTDGAHQEVAQKREASKSPMVYETLRGMAAKATAEQQRRANQGPIPNHDSDRLLRLMQQKDSAPEPRQPPSFPSDSQNAYSNPMFAPPPHFLDHLPNDPIPPPNLINPQVHPQRAEAQHLREHGPPGPPKFFDPPFFTGPHVHSHDQASRLPGMPPPGPPPFDPSGMPPPGHQFDAPPGWPQQQAPHPRHSSNPALHNNGMNPPPGIPNPSAGPVQPAWLQPHPIHFPPPSHPAQNPHLPPPPGQPAQQRPRTLTGEGNPNFPPRNMLPGQPGQPPGPNPGPGQGFLRSGVPVGQAWPWAYSGSGTG